MKLSRRKFLVALSAIPVAGVVVDRATSTHVMADEIADMRVGDRMVAGRIHRSDHAADAYSYLIGYNDTIRAKHQRAVNAALRERIDTMVFERFSS